MVDIAAERLWLQRMNAEAEQADIAHQRRMAQEDAEARAATCPYCFHARHEIQYASSSWSGRSGDPWITTDLGDPTVLYCRETGCICGVSPCRTCGSRIRADEPDARNERCAGCGATWDAGGALA